MIAREEILCISAPLTAIEAFPIGANARIPISTFDPVCFITIWKMDVVTHSAPYSVELAWSMAGKCRQYEKVTWLRIRASERLCHQQRRSDTGVMQQGDAQGA